MIHDANYRFTYLPCHTAGNVAELMGYWYCYTHNFPQDFLGVCSRQVESWCNQDVFIYLPLYIHSFTCPQVIAVHCSVLFSESRVNRNDYIVANISKTLIFLNIYLILKIFGKSLTNFVKFNSLILAGSGDINVFKEK